MYTRVYKNFSPTIDVSIVGILATATSVAFDLIRYILLGIPLNHNYN